MSPRDWYVRLNDDADVALVAFPHAGAGSARMVRLAKAVSPQVAVWAANLPGRQARLAEPPITDLDTLVGELTDRLADLVRPPYALFGYCGGALLAFLVARALRDRGAPAPVALMVASYEAPDIAYRPRRLADLPTRLLWSELINQGGITEEMAADERLRGVAERAIRADFAMIGRYRHLAAPPLNCPVVVCFGSEDRTPRGAWLGWRRQTTQPPRLCRLDGGHWLLDEAGDGLARLVVETLTDGPR
jgi:surfactin synthase thioesterase subunit